MSTSLRVPHDGWLWLGIGVVSFATARLIAWQLHETVRLNEIYDAPPPTPTPPPRSTERPPQRHQGASEHEHDHRREAEPGQQNRGAEACNEEDQDLTLRRQKRRAQPKQPEDEIPLSILSELAFSSSYDIREAATKIIADQWSKSQKCREALLEELDAEDWMQRESGQDLLDVLRDYSIDALAVPGHSRNDENVLGNGQPFEEALAQFLMRNELQVITPRSTNGDDHANALTEDNHTMMGADMASNRTELMGDDERFEQAVTVDDHGNLNFAFRRVIDPTETNIGENDNEGGFIQPPAWNAETVNNSSEDEGLFLSENAARTQSNTAVPSLHNLIESDTLPSNHILATTEPLTNRADENEAYPYMVEEWGSSTANSSNAATSYVGQLLDSLFDLPQSSTAAESPMQSQALTQSQTRGAELQIPVTTSGSNQMPNPPQRRASRDHSAEEVERRRGRREAVVFGMDPPDVADDYPDDGEEGAYRAHDDRNHSYWLRGRTGNEPVHGQREWRRSGEMVLRVVRPGAETVDVHLGGPGPPHSSIPGSTDASGNNRRSVSTVASVCSDGRSSGAPNGLGGTDSMEDRNEASQRRNTGRHGSSPG